MEIQQTSLLLYVLLMLGACCSLFKPIKVHQLKCMDKFQVIKKLRIWFLIKRLLSINRIKNKAKKDKNNKKWPLKAANKKPIKNI